MPHLMFALLFVILYRDTEKNTRETQGHARLRHRQTETRRRTPRARNAENKDRRCQKHGCGCKLTMLLFVSIAVLEVWKSNKTKGKNEFPKRSHLERISALKMQAACTGRILNN